MEHVPSKLMHTKINKLPLVNNETGLKPAFYCVWVPNFGMKDCWADIKMKQW